MLDRFRQILLSAVLQIVGWVLPRSRPAAAWVLAERVARYAHDGDRIVVRIGSEGRLAIELCDPYWSRLLVPRFKYEGELASLLSLLAPLKPAFVDGGANIGYWSVLLSGAPFDCEPIIAVEASPQAAAKLQANLTLNDLPHEVLLRAITRRSGELVSLDPGANHSGTHVSEVGPAEQDARECVMTISLDEIVSARPALEGRQIIVKLDIEGQEIAAFEGAGGLIDDPRVTFVYEDHGQDRSSAVTQWVLDRSPRTIYLLDRSRTVHISSAGQLGELKTSAAVGYNLVAVHPEGQAAQLLRRGVTQAGTLDEMGP